MKILIKGAEGVGWSEYTINGTKRKPRDKDLIEIIEGNPKLGDLITNQGNWKENEYQIVLAFRGKPPREVIRKAVKMFKKHFMAGFEDDEFHFDAVAHYDSDDSHVHIRIPKENQRTGTQLQLYWHKKDVDRMNLIRDYINFELDLDVSVDEKPLIKESADMERIQRWRGQNGQEPFEFKTKKNRERAKIMIAHVIKAEHESGSIESIEDLKSFFAERYPQYDIVTDDGYDIPKGFYYFTIQNQEGKKLRLDGEFYSEAFWQKTRELRLEQFDNNKSTPKPVEAKIDVAAKLELATQKRIEEIEAKYKKSRARVAQERGRELARQKKYNLKIEAEEKENDLNRRSDQTARTRVSTGEIREEAREGSIDTRVYPSVAELVADSFIINTGRSEEVGESRSSEAGRTIIDSVRIEDTSERGDSISVAESNRELLESIRQLESSIPTFAEEVEGCLESIGIESQTEQFGINFENIIGDKIRDFKTGINEWGERHLEENGRKIEEYGRRFKEGLGGLKEHIEKWLKNALVRGVWARNAEERISNALPKSQLKNIKPSL